MKIAVVGAGVVGIACAWQLRRDGHEVAVYDAADGPACGTSHATGGQVAISHSAPWSTPDLPRQLLRWLGRADAPFRLGMTADPGRLAWCLRFLRECAPRRHRRHAAANLRLALLSRIELATMRTAANIDNGHLQHGILHVHADAHALSRAAYGAEALERENVRQQVLDRQQMLDLEPALEHETDGLIGAIYAPGDESGDTREFTEQLAADAARQGVAFRYGTAIDGLRVDRGRLRALLSGSEEIPCAAAVIAAGCGSRELLAAHGIHLHIQPVKGYSVSLPLAAGAVTPTLSITHAARRMVVTPLGAILRAAGTAEVRGDDTALDPHRAALVLDGLRALFPEAGDYWQATSWTGLRPMTADGPPLLGATPVAGLFLDTGHGALGWTLAAGSARVVADLVAGREPPIDITGLTLEGRA